MLAIAKRFVLGRTTTTEKRLLALEGFAAAAVVYRNVAFARERAALERLNG